ncbi:hypothetical protein ACIGW7_35220 [Streptomyces sp. NPDC053253]|uniref:hypothetical protein n=1 Tax=Streptomyces sp. NPDC053253 TaxID=3365699 RepID=UPI0037D42D3D
MRTRPLARTALTLASAAALAVGLASAASAATAGRTVTDGTRTYNLSLTAPNTASAAGTNVTVTGSGYNPDQGVYVGLCAIPAGVNTADPTTWNNKPTPCLGGQDETGTTGASHWVNSPPPNTPETTTETTTGTTTETTTDTTTGTTTGGLAATGTRIFPATLAAVSLAALGAAALVLSRRRKSADKQDTP